MLVQGQLVYNATDFLSKCHVLRQRVVHKTDLALALSIVKSLVSAARKPVEAHSPPDENFQLDFQEETSCEGCETAFIIALLWPAALLF